MAMTRVDHATLTVTTVKVFKETMQFINELNLWDDAQAYLKEQGKTEMFIDAEVLFHFRQMLEQHPRFDPKHPAVAAVRGHRFHFLGEPSSESK